MQIQRLKCKWWRNLQCDVLRLDQLHPVVSGNKWFKLQYYLQEAINEDREAIATFGGAYSNHIVATAFACREAGLPSIGFIRGEKPPQVSASLQEATYYGMRLVYLSRADYADKRQVIDAHAAENWLWINEGGYGIQGMRGAKDILRAIDTSVYSHIACACGTGTTLAGLVAAAQPSQRCLGISCLKGYVNLEKDVMELLDPAHQHKRVEVFHDYHFGGYAKHPAELIEWMNMLWREEQLPTDIVYTSKLMYAVKDLVAKNHFTNDNKILIIHSGGLQGNRSLPEGTLAFL